MKRREFLHRTGATTALAGLAGCLGTTSDTAPPAGDGTERDDGMQTTDGNATTTGETAFSGVESEADEPFRTASVGGRDGVAFPEQNRPRTLRVWNATDVARSISVKVGRGETTAFDERVEFEPDAYLAVALNEPDDYRVSVGVFGTTDSTGSTDADSGSASSGGASASGTAFPVPRSSFDCNDATIDVGITSDDRIEVTTIATMMACDETPTVAESNFGVGRGECGTEHRASVAFDRERVRVDGAVRTPTPRTDLALAATAYDADADVLTVRVRTTAETVRATATAQTDETSEATETTETSETATMTETTEAGAGTQCVGEVPYEADVRFERALPGTVAVVHESNEGTTEVARTTRDSTSSE